MSTEKVDDAFFERLQISKTFKQPTALVNGFSWSSNGKALITSTDDNVLHLFSIENAELHRTYRSPPDFPSIDAVTFVYGGAKTCLVVCHSMNEEQTDQQLISDIRLWNLDDNHIIRIFPLPPKVRVLRSSGLQVHPNRDFFLVAANDAKIRLYEMSNELPMAIIPANLRQPLASFDSEGLIFACLLSRRAVHLFSCEEYKSGDFQNFDISEAIKPQKAEITALVFSPDGSGLIVCTNHHQLYCFDAFSGTLRCEYKFDIPSPLLSPVKSYGFPSFTPDSQYLLCGGVDMSIHVWNVADGRIVRKLKGHSVLPRWVKFHPTKALLATAALNIVWWQPSIIQNADNQVS